MNWGYKIAITFVAFVLFLGVLVYRSFQAKVNLVAPDYYKQELVFQDHINKIENEQALEHSASISHDGSLEELTIGFPMNLEVSAGQLALYRPSDASMDRRMELKLTSENYLKVSTADLAGGLWTVKLEWQDQSAKSYFKEQNVFFP